MSQKKGAFQTVDQNANHLKGHLLITPTIQPLSVVVCAAETETEGPDIIVPTELQMKLDVQQKHFRSTSRYEDVYRETFWNIGWSVSVFTMNHVNQVLIYSGKECYTLHLEAVRAFHLGP